MQSLYSHCFPSSDGVQVGVSGEEVDEGEGFDARGGPDILVRGESDAWHFTRTRWANRQKSCVNG